MYNYRVLDKIGMQNQICISRAYLIVIRMYGKWHEVLHVLRAKLSEQEDTGA